MAAYRDHAWWSNTSSSAHAKAWLDAGWEVQEVNFKEGYAVFKKVRNVAFKKSKKKKLEITQPFTPVPVHKPKIKDSVEDQSFKALRKNQKPRTTTSHATSANQRHSSSSHRSIRSDFIKTMKNHNSNRLLMGLRCPLA